MILGDNAEEPKYSMEAYLENKSPEIINLHNDIYSKMKERIPEVYEDATPNYISLKNSNGKNICEFHLQKNKLLIQTRVPEDETLLIGEKVPDSYLWALNYRVYVDEETDKNKVVEILISALKQIQ
ncbi:MAG: hypothetical protein IJP63_00280 [Acholeplasmatales bacterium]|nr:hypothetical protein [Acholeplasmatales bacterium]